jgi:hypothetical protein
MPVDEAYPGTALIKHVSSEYIMLLAMVGCPSANATRTCSILFTLPQEGFGSASHQDSLLAST